MKIVDVSRKKPEDSRLNEVNRSLGKLIPSQAREARNAQETVINLFGKILDNRFHLVTGVRLPVLEGLNAMILIGPPGVWLLEANPSSGVFRAKPDAWEELDPKSRVYRAVKPSLPARMLAAAKTLRQVLSAHVPDLPAVEPLALFTNPGAHLELQSPPVRMIQADAIGRFAVSLLQSRVVLDREAVQRLVEVFSAPSANLAAIEPIGEDEAREVPAGVVQPPRLPVIPESEPDIVRRVSRFASFTLFQWLVLALLVLLVIGVLIAGILVVVLLT